MFSFIHDIEWMRAYSRKNKRKQHKKSVQRNYRRIYQEIKWRAKQGMNEATIRFMIYDENVRRLVSEGYEVKKISYISGSQVWSVKW